MVGFEGWEHILMHIEHRSLYREQGWSWMISNFAHCIMPYIVFLDANPPLGMVILGSKKKFTYAWDFIVQEILQTRVFFSVHISIY